MALLEFFVLARASLALPQMSQGSIIICKNVEFRAVVWNRTKAQTCYGYIYKYQNQELLAHCHLPHLHKWNNRLSILRKLKKVWVCNQDPHFVCLFWPKYSALQIYIVFDNFRLLSTEIKGTIPLGVRGNPISGSEVVALPHYNVRGAQSQDYHYSDLKQWVSVFKEKCPWP